MQFSRLLPSLNVSFPQFRIPFLKQHKKEKKLPPKKKRYLLRWLVVLFFVTIAIFSYATNPFVRFSLVKDPYDIVTHDQNIFSIQKSSDISVESGKFVDRLVFAKSSWHILTGKISGGPKSPKTTVDEIIKAIHTARFDPDHPFIISGDHFSMFYPRSLGIFYHTLLDPRTALDETDWQNRQRIYLKSVAYGLDVYSQSEKLSTTIVPIGPGSVALMNVYAPPSDTLYSLLLGLENLLSEEYLRSNYPYDVEAPEYEAQLQTQEAAQVLLDQHKDNLKRHYETFLRDTVDPATGLVRKDILLSSTKDMAKRESAFYDNVMLWKTHQQVQTLGIVDENPLLLADLKKRIIDTFWLEKEGYFLEDLSQKGIDEKYYSSDWLIAYQVGMLDPDDPQDRVYLERSIAYIQRNALDQPFGLQYHADPRPDQLHLVVNVAAPHYGSTTIWSNWGQEYTKLLAHLAVVTGNEDYLRTAKDQIEAYTFNIKRYQGYPELYDDQGDFYRERLYKSVRQTGWVVSFEQAREMVIWSEREMEL